MAQAELEHLRSNNCKFCHSPYIEESSCEFCNNIEVEQWTIGFVKHTQRIGTSGKNSKNDGGNKKENRKKKFMKTNMIKKSRTKIPFQGENKEIEGNDDNDKNYQKEADDKTMHKKVCELCEEILVGSSQNELKILVKSHFDDQNPFLEKCEFCETIFHAETEDLVIKRLFEHNEICKDNNEKEDVEGDLDDNEKNYKEEDKDFTLFINELLIDEIEKLPMTLKEKSKLLKPLKFLENEKICKGNNEKEDVEGDLDDNDNNYQEDDKLKEIMEKIKLFSDKEKHNKEIYLLKMVDKIKESKISLKDKSKILKSLKLNFKQCKNCQFITEETCILEQHQLIHHQTVTVDIHTQSNPPQAESEREDITPINIETSPPEGVDNIQQFSNRPSSSYPRTLSIFHKSMRKFILDEDEDENEKNFQYPKKKKMPEFIKFNKDETEYEINVQLDKKKMKMKINKMRNFLKFDIDQDVPKPNVSQIKPPASNNFSVDRHYQWIQYRLTDRKRKFKSNAPQTESEKESIVLPNMETTPHEEVDNTQQLFTQSLLSVEEDVIQPNTPQTESEKEAIARPNMETPPLEEVDNTQKLFTRSLSSVEEDVIQSNAPEKEPEKEAIKYVDRVSWFPDPLFYFHKSMQCPIRNKKGTKRKFNLDEDDNEENVELPIKKMKMGMKKMWYTYFIHWGRLGHRRIQRRAQL